MRRLLLYGMTLLLLLSARAQQADTNSLYRKVEAFGQALPQEKVYLHLDDS